MNLSEHAKSQWLGLAVAFLYGTPQPTLIQLSLIESTKEI